MDAHFKAEHPGKNCFIKLNYKMLDKDWNFVTLFVKKNLLSKLTGRELC